MKKDFFDVLQDLMLKNNNVYFISIGLGYPRLDFFKNNFPDRYIQTEASEQTALDIAVGLAYSGKIPVLYTITPFYLRAFETIRTYINHENLNVIMVGAGRDDDYSKHDGFSHDASDIELILRTQHNIFLYFPNTLQDLKKAFDIALNIKGPNFISIRR